MRTGILLAGGAGTRLRPFTTAINKSLLNINGKAVIDYSLATLKAMGITEVFIILGGDHHEQIINYLGDGERYGMSFAYVYQGKPKGISQAISLCERFIDPDDDFVVILGDNIFTKPIEWRERDGRYGAQVVLDECVDLQRFGVASLRDGQICKIEEKPKSINYIDYTNYAIAGCYLFDAGFFEFFRGTRPSERGEFEITEIIQAYLDRGSLRYIHNPGAWFDAGTHESIAAVTKFLMKGEE